MALPSRVLNSGVTSLSTVAICGEGTVDITAAGATIVDAAPLTSIYNRVTTTAAGTGVRLPPTEMGATIWVTNLGANPLTVYPADTNSTIVGSASNVLIPRASACYWAASNTRWEVTQGYGTVLPAAYGAFYSTIRQNAALINTAYAATFNSTYESYLVSIGTPSSRIVCSLPGVYNFEFSAQLDKAAAASAHIYIWARVNGVDIANSASFIVISGPDAETVASWNFVQSMAAGDYFELMWSTDDTNVFLEAFAAAAPVPAIPSVILTATQIR